MNARFRAVILVSEESCGRTHLKMEKDKEKKKDRHVSNTGMSGLTKKQGAGGKGTWGKGGIDDLKQNGLDADDPNYASDEEEVLLAKTEVTSPIVSIVHDFLLSGDVIDVVSGLKELSNTPNVHEQFVKKALTVSMDHHAYEREQISKLLSGLYNDVIPPEKFTIGFQICLDAIDDLALDTPDATEVLAKFLARAIVDEIVPPAFIKSAVVSTPKGEEVLAMASGLITESHRLDRLAHIWGPGDLSSVKRLKEEVNFLLQEYLTSGDTQEADKSVRRLNVPSFHFQLVKQAVRMALQIRPEERRKLSLLLSFFYGTGLVSSEHIEKGLRTCHGSIKDISLDVPNAEQLLQEFISQAKGDGYLLQEFTL